MAQTSTRFNGSICGICIAVCPYTEAALRRSREGASA
jgi:epoxyqueuosine reductase QueG